MICKKKKKTHIQDFFTLTMFKNVFSACKNLFASGQMKIRNVKNEENVLSFQQHV